MGTNELEQIFPSRTMETSKENFYVDIRDFLLNLPCEVVDFP